MNVTWPPFAGWLLHSAVGGGLLLLLALPMMWACCQPARRQRLGEAALLAALALCILNLGPSWITLPLFPSEQFVPPAPASQPSVVRRELALASSPLSENDANFEREVSEEQRGDDDPAVLDDAAAALMLSILEAAPPDVHPAPDTASGIRSALASLNVSRWLPSLAIAYAAASVFLLGRWLLGHCVLWRLLRNAQPAPEAIYQIFETMARGPGRRPRLLISKRLRVPLSCGLIRPCVVLPASFCESNAVGALRWLFAHELTHLERGDAWTCLLFGLGQALYFCLPWFWWLRRQVRLCQEYVADAAAAEQAANPEDYAQFLVSLTRAPAVPLGALGVLGNSSDLFRRVTMLLQNPIRVEKRCPRWWSLATASGLLGLALLVSGIGLRADAARAQGDTAVVTVVADETESADKPDKAGEVRKARKVIVVEDNEPADKKDPKKRPAVEKVLRDLEELLKDLPSAVDADQVKHLQEMLKKSQREMEHAIDHLKREVDSGKLDVLKKHLRELHSGDVLLNEDVLRNAEEVLKKSGDVLRNEDVFRGGELLLEGDGHELHVRRGGGRLGVQVQKPGSVLADQLDLPKGQGLVIEQVVPDSAAAKAGLKAHDVLLEFNGKSVPNEAAKFIKMVEEVKANTTVSAIVLRRGKKETIKGISLSEAKTKEEKRFIFGVAPGEGVAPFTFGLPNVGIGVGHGKHGVITTIIRTNDTFTTRYQEGSLVITVTGSVADGKSKVKQIEIQDGGKNETYENADKVPEQYRSKVRNLIEMSEKNNLKVEVGANFDATPKGKPVTIIFEKGNAAAVARAVGRMLPQMRRNPIRIIIPGSETVRRIGSADAGSPGDPNMSLTLTAFGNKLVVACEDQQAQNLVQELSRLLTQTELSDADFEVIKLKTARAADAVKILDEAFNGNNRAMTEQEKRVAGAVRVVADPTTNSMLVRARPAEMVRIRKFVDAFIDKDEANAKPSGTADPSKGN